MDQTTLKSGRRIHLPKKYCNALGLKPGALLMIHKGDAGIPYVVLVSMEQLYKDSLFQDLDNLWLGIDRDMIEFYLRVKGRKAPAIRKL